MYVQKKSCSLTSRGGAVSASGELRNRVAFVSLGALEVVKVEVEAGILNDCYTCVSMGRFKLREEWFESARFVSHIAKVNLHYSSGLQFSGVQRSRATQSSGFSPQRVSRLGVDLFRHSQFYMHTLLFHFEESKS